MAEDLERWMHLAEIVVEEQDPKKMMELVRELNELLTKKRKRLDNLPHDPEPPQT